MSLSHAELKRRSRKAKYMCVCVWLASSKFKVSSLLIYITEISIANFIKLTNLHIGINMASYGGDTVVPILILFINY